MNIFTCSSLNGDVYRSNYTTSTDWKTMNNDLAGFEVLTAVVRKGSVFWDIVPCTPLSVNRRFG
jgi:hypothetical protein